MSKRKRFDDGTPAGKTAKAKGVKKKQDRQIKKALKEYHEFVKDTYTIPSDLRRGF